MEIPHKSLKRETLIEILKDIVTRDGTDYGLEEKSLEARVASALRSLERGDSCLFWNEETETTSLHAANNKPAF